ncbi:MAG: PfkB family carbohydrate kinase [Actinomycetota bacterium]|nr:PfkB family carbohydrate kinase [Actinomycetota bacterium]
MAEPDVVVACPSLALDRTLLVDRLVAGQMHRPLRVDARGGGKGGNVARVLAALGRSVHLVGIVGPADDPEADFVIRSLRRAGIRVTALRGSATRTCTTVVEAPTATVTAFYEPAPPCVPALWDQFATEAKAAGDGGSIFVLTGSLPPGVEASQVAELAWAAISVSTAVVCDLAGAALAAVLPSRPDIVTPNLTEAATALDLTGELPGLEPPVDLARLLVAAGARAAVVSAGSSGAGVASTGPGAPGRVPAPAVRARNPTGAGDVLTAALAHGLRGGRPLGRSVEQAVRLASASCTTFAAADLPPRQEVPSWRP